MADAQIFTAPLPVGVILPYGGTAAPNGWFLCDGSTISRAGNSALFAVIGTTFGAGDGSTTFNLPDMGGRVPAGKEASATRLTSGGSGVDGATLGATGGSETHTLTEAELAVHTHPDTFSVGVPALNNGTNQVTSTSSFVGGAGGGATQAIAAGTGDNVTITANAPSITGAVQDAGSGAAHNNAQPTVILNYIIKAT